MKPNQRAKPLSVMLGKECMSFLSGLFRQVCRVQGDVLAAFKYREVIHFFLSSLAVKSIVDLGETSAKK